MRAAIGNRQSAIVRAPWCATVALSLLLAACGGGNEPAAPQAASLEGDRASVTKIAYAPAVDLDKAPTEAHRKLARLLPKEALRKDTVSYGGWDAAKAGMSLEDAENAMLPGVAAEYLSTGYRILGDGEDKVAKQDYPQNCSLYLIQAPEKLATEEIMRKISAKLNENGFSARDPLELAMGLTTRRQGDPNADVKVTEANDAGGTSPVIRPGEARTVAITRYVRIDHTGERDKVYIAYIYAVDDLVLYALEVENPPPVVGPDGSQLQRVTDNRGSRVGGQLITQVLYRLNG
jgi:hypothetical protein